MVTLGNVLTRHPNERATHPVDTSNASERPRTRRIRSTSWGASYDRIVSPPKLKARTPGPVPPSTPNASFDAAASSESSARQRALHAPRPTLFTAYRLKTHIRIGMSVSFFT